MGRSKGVAVIAGFSPWLGLRPLPALDRARQSSVAGIHVVGDLGDAPMLKAAMNQGSETGQELAAALGSPAGGIDVVIVGAGPAGICAALTLHESGFGVLVLERDRLFHTIQAFPAGKILYAEPATIPPPTVLPFVDAPKEELVSTWAAVVAQTRLPVRLAEEVVAIDGADGAFEVQSAASGVKHTYSCRKVVLATGRRGAPRRLGVPGEQLAKVRSMLDEPAELRDRDVLVVGGGDAAAESACALAEAGARVVLATRRARLDHPRRRNRARVERWVAAGRIRLLCSARVVAIEPDSVTLDVAGRPERVPNHDVFVLIGGELPRRLLDQVGIALQSDRARELRRIPWLLGFAALVWCFYVLKQGRELFPFTPGLLGWVHDALRVQVPWIPTADGSMRVLDAGFWGTALYSLVIAGFAAVAWRKYPSPIQRRRYASLVAFQLVFLFAIPELIAPALTSQAAKAYSFSVPWPLSIWSLAHEPAAWAWLALGAVTTFVLVPLYVWRNNEKFCSYLCGCGGLAETVGDLWRWRAPRGDGPRRAERAGRLVLLLAIAVTLLVLNDLWGMFGSHTWLDQEVALTGPAIGPAAPDERPGAMRIADAWFEAEALHLRVDKLELDGWRPTGWIREVTVGQRTIWPEKVEDGHYRVFAPPGTRAVRVHARSSSLSGATEFARQWYSLMVDFALASVLGVALYPYLGNRVWCRFLCPLRAYMELISRRIGRLAIRADDRCISCGECTRHCQMGIDVQGFAQQQLHFDNATTACIQCGICVDVCPMGTLQLVDKRASGLPDGKPGEVGPRWG